MESIFMSEPLNHHYIPQFHLKRFRSSGKAAHHLWVLQLGSDQIKMCHPRNVAYEPNLYRLDSLSDPVAAERAFSRFESDAAPAFRQLLESLQLAELSDDDRGLVALFLTSLLARHPAFREVHANVLRGGLSKRIASGVASDSSHLQETVEKNTQACYLTFLQEDVPALAQAALDSYSWLLCHPAPGCAFVLGDMPVLITSGVPDPPLPALEAGSQWWLPLTPDCCLLFQAPPMALASDALLVLPAALVSFLNRCQYENAREQIFGHDASLLQSVAGAPNIGYRSPLPAVRAGAIAAVPLGQ
jgi:hypothetical protein